MKTKLILVLIVALALLLSACGTQPADNSADDNPAKDMGQNNAVDEPIENSSGDSSAGQANEPAAEDAAGDAAAVSFAGEVFPILESRCLRCHGGDRLEGEMSMLSYGELMAGSQSGVVIIPGDAAGSLLFQLVSSGEMPKRGANLTAAQIDVIMKWIDAGALDN